MLNYLSAMQNMLSEDEKKQLMSIYEPQVVAIPPIDARRDMCIMKDGEIRHYGLADRKQHGDEGKVIYLYSRNCGLTWSKKYATSNDVMGASVYLPWCNYYVTIKPLRIGDNPGTYAYISNIGPDDEQPIKIKLTDTIHGDIFQPVYFEGSNRIFVTTAHPVDADKKHNPVVFFSDDNGYTWTNVDLKATPMHEVRWPDRGIRWQNTGTEPSMTKLPDGRLALVARTSLEYLYVYYSKDNGESWSDGEPADFHCTLTTPFIFSLSDGRIVLFWNNTRPLPEMATEEYNPPAKAGWASVFTNRDAAHCAVSNDGMNWVGFREIFLNTARNNADYRTISGAASGADRSVQQFQAIELPFHKILVSFGQNESMRKMIIFDIDWLYETTRTEEFKCGLSNVSTFTYVRSVSGCQIRLGLSGHCHWNRTNGALLMPDPTLNEGEALFLCTTKDPRLFSNVQGCVWNFPMSRKGKIVLKLWVEGKGIQLSLTDHWFNPIDTTISKLAQFSVSITTSEIAEAIWKDVTIEYDLDQNEMTLYDEHHIIANSKLLNWTSTGISYLHIHTLGEKADYKGTYIGYMSKENC